MFIGPVKFTITDPNISEFVNIVKLTIISEVLAKPRIIIEGTILPGCPELSYDEEYDWTIEHKDFKWEGTLTINDAVSDTKGGRSNINCTLLPHSLALEKSSRNYNSIQEVIDILCSGLITPPFDSEQAYYNQLGTDNWQYVYQIALKQSPGYIPAFSRNKLVMVDYENGDEEYDLSEYGRQVDDSGLVTEKSPKTFSSKVDLYDVNCTSGYSYRIAREKMNISIIGEEYESAFYAESYNKQILEDLENSVNLTYSNVCNADIGDVVKYNPGTGIKRYLILGATWEFTQGGQLTKLKVRELRS